MNNLNIEDKIPTFNLLLSALNVKMTSFFKLNVEYSAQKTIYHILRFNSLLLEIGHLIKTSKPDLEYPSGFKFLRIDSDIYYEFDAICISSRSLFENGLLEDARKELREELFASNEELIKEIRDRFMTYIRPIRNDTVHLNPSDISLPAFDTASRTNAISVMAYYIHLDDKLGLLTSRKYNGVSLDIIESVNIVEKITSQFINYSLDLLARTALLENPTLTGKNSITVDGISHLVSLEDFII